MTRFELLDAGPLALGCCDPSQPLAGRFRAWLSLREMAGVTVLIPAIADYEVRREFIRAEATAKLMRLTKLRNSFAYIEMTQEALDQAARF